MKKSLSLLAVLLFIVACVPLPSSTNTSVKKTIVQSTNKTTVVQGPPKPPEPTAIKCEDKSDRSTTMTQGKVVIYYDNGQKESFEDYCAKGDFAFRIEYFCDGATAKTRINKCNQSCVKGVCYNVALENISS